jgi:hypothetical protein
MQTRHPGNTSSLRHSSAKKEADWLDKLQAKYERNYEENVTEEEDEQKWWRKMWREIRKGHEADFLARCDSLKPRLKSDDEWLKLEQDRDSWKNVSDLQTEANDKLRADLEAAKHEHDSFLVLSDNYDRLEREFETAKEQRIKDFDIFKETCNERARLEQELSAAKEDKGVEWLIRCSGCGRKGEWHIGHKRWFQRGQMKNSRGIATWCSRKCYRLAEKEGRLK